MAHILKDMGDQKDNMFEYLAETFKPRHTTAEMNTGLTKLGNHLEKQIEKLNTPVKQPTRTEINDLTEKWIDYLETQAFDPMYKKDFVIGFMKGRLMSLLTGYMTPEDTIKEMERVTR